MKKSKILWIDAEGIYTCPHCGFGYDPYNQYYQNRKIAHTNRDDFVYLFCPICGKKTVDRAESEE